MGDQFLVDMAAVEAELERRLVVVRRMMENVRSGRPPWGSTT